MTIAAELGEVSCFPDARELMGYCGAVPSENSSGKRIQCIQASASPLGHYEAFFYPLDKIAQWNRGYGRRGFMQYQFVILFDNGLAEMRRVLTTILSSGELSFLTALKRLAKRAGDPLLPVRGLHIRH